MGEQLIAAAQRAFGNEDSQMIKACQHTMGTTDLMPLNPVLLSTDAPAVWARRLPTARVEAEVRRAA